MIFKRLASICFALAFMLAIPVFTGIFSSVISKPNARLGIIFFGGVALLLNLLAFRFDKKSENNNFIFWIGSVFVFSGLIMKIQHFPYDQYVLIAGLFVIGLSYFFNPFKREEEANDDLLDS